MTVNTTKLRAELVQDEGYKTKSYYDTMHILTGGIGHNLEAHGQANSYPEGSNIPDAIIQQWFDDDLARALTCCQAVFDSFNDLPDNVQRALANMAFDLMYELREWRHLISAIADKDWQAASLSIMDSKFAQQAPNRCARLSVRMIKGDS